MSLLHVMFRMFKKKSQPKVDLPCKTKAPVSLRTEQTNKLTIEIFIIRFCFRPYRAPIS